MTRAFIVDGHWKILAGPSVLAMLLSTAALGQAAASVPDTSAPGARIQTENLTEPTPRRRFAPTYPVEEMSRNIEGWVQLSMMVDARGKPFEISVEASSGNKAFEKEA